MNWIDITLTAAHILSMVGLLPTLLDKRSIVPRLSSIPKAIAATATTPCYFLLGAYSTSIAALLISVCWWLIAIDRAPREQ